MTPAQKELIERARKNGGLLPTRGYNIQTLQILRQAGLIRTGSMREDFAAVESEIMDCVRNAGTMLAYGQWKEARARLNEAWEKECSTLPRCYRLTKLGETCNLAPPKA